MYSPKIFISYSRDNKLYVSSLVKAFRDEGFTVWFDNHIKTGEDWDSSIEREIKEADALVMVLSETSVASENVKDEMSYAMSLNKHINPIKIEECDVPMRLARKQFIDFTKLGHEAGFQKLVGDIKQNLGVTELEGGTTSKTVFTPNIDPKSNKATPKPPQQKEIPTQPNKTTSHQPQSQPAHATPKKNSKVPFIIGGVLLLAVAAYFLIPRSEDPIIEETGSTVSSLKIKNEPNLSTESQSLNTSGDVAQEQAAFNSAANTKTLDSYQSYNENYPNGLYAERVADSIEKILKVKDRQDSIAKVTKRSADWELAKSKNTLDDYIVFIKTYEQGKEVDEAKKLRAQLESARENKKRDNLLWDNITQAPSVNSYLDYYTDSSIIGLHKEEVFEMVNSVGKQGYLFYGRVQNDTLSKSNVFNVICCGEGQINHDKRPEVNDILLIESAVRTYSDKSRGYATGSVLTVGNKALVTEVLMEGSNAIIVKVAF